MREEEATHGDGGGIHAGEIRAQPEGSVAPRRQRLPLGGKHGRHSGSVAIALCPTHEPVDAGLLFPSSVADAPVVTAVVATPSTNGAVLLVGWPWAPGELPFDTTPAGDRLHVRQASGNAGGCAGGDVGMTVISSTRLRARPPQHLGSDRR